MKPIANETKNYVEILPGVTIDEIDTVKAQLERQGQGIKNCDVEVVKAYIRKNHAVVYFDSCLAQSSGAQTDSKYAWLDTGVVNENGERLVISCCNKNKDIFAPQRYEGHYVGPVKKMSELASKFFTENAKEIRGNASKAATIVATTALAREDKDVMAELKAASDAIDAEAKRRAEEEAEAKAEERRLRAERVREERAKREADAKVIEEAEKIEEDESESSNDFDRSAARDVRALLLADGWKTQKGFDRFLKVAGYRLWQLERDGMAEDYAEFGPEGVALINTGLLDKYGGFIKALYRKARGEYRFWQGVNGKADVIGAGFTREQAGRKLKPLSFHDRENDRFDAESIDDFDLNYRNLNHVISERRRRFPESVQSASDMTLANKVHGAIETALAVQSVDDGYVRPLYTTATEGISWVVPFRVNVDMNQGPELALIVHKTGDFYEVKTVLPYDDSMKDKLQVTSLYSGMAW